MHVNIVITENNIYRVEELITVNFKVPRRGLIRDIPKRFYGYNHKIENIEVTDFYGSFYKTEINDSGNQLSIRIGDPNVYLEGINTYRIYYEFDMGTDNLKNQDEVYWNVIGTEWSSVIKNASFNIMLPKRFDTKSLNFTVGKYGSTDNTRVYFDVTGNEVYGEVIGSLNAYEGVTMALVLPEGYFINTSTTLAQKIPTNEISLILIVLLSFFVLKSFMIRKETKNSIEDIHVKLNHKAPLGMNPAEMAYLLNRNLFSKDITSLVIYWADLGLLDIIEEEKYFFKIKYNHYYLRKKKDIEKISDRKYEIKLFNKLFSYADDDNIVDLKDLQNKFYKDVNKAKSELEAYMGNKHVVYCDEFKINKKTNEIITSLIGYLFFVNNLFSYTEHILASILFPTLILFALKTFSLFTSKEIKLYKAKKDKANKILKIIFFFLFGLPIIMNILVFGFTFGIAIFKENGQINLFNIISGLSLQTIYIVIAVILIIISYRNTYIVYKITEKGKEILGEIKGFIDYIETAERDELEMMIDKNPDYYYNILPYALVFGLTTVWSNKFDDLISEPPNWYSGSSSPTFNASNFGRSLNNSMSSISSSMSSSPRSSSSGGSSGGGGGGGGGSSW